MKEITAKIIIIRPRHTYIIVPIIEPSIALSSNVLL
jgi:hypothetical protein